MASKTKKKAPPTRAEAIKEVRIIGTINLVLGLYMVLDGLTAMADLADLPGPGTRMAGGVIGMAAIAVAWGTAVANGLGLLLLKDWGRWLAIKWGKIIFWLLPIAFGLSTDSLSDFFSLGFVVIVALGIYAMAIANGLQKPEADIAFMPEPIEQMPVSRQHDDRAQPVQPPIQRNEPVPETIMFKCEECGKQYTVRASLAGKKARCKDCGRQFEIPFESSI